MAINDMITKARIHAVSRADGKGEEVVYHHVKTAQSETLRCYPQKITEGELSKDKENWYTTFRTVITETKPNRGDFIMYLDEKWHYEHISGHRHSNIYNVVCSIKKHRIGR